MPRRSLWHSAAFGKWSECVWSNRCRVARPYLWIRNGGARLWLAMPRRPTSHDLQTIMRSTLG